MDLSNWDWIGRVALAAALSGLVGFERSAHHKAAGLRTHMLVGMGAALFALAGTDFASADTSRVAAGVVTGVGFLGAGAIFRHGFSVRGLTTAAGLWVVAAIGVVTGAGEPVPAAATAGLAVIILNGLTMLERFLRERADRKATRVLVSVQSPSDLGDVMNVLVGIDERARESQVRVDDRGAVEVSFLVEPAHLPTLVALGAVMDQITNIDQVSAG